MISGAWPLRLNAWTLYLFSSFTSELILSHSGKMLIPWKHNHSKSNSKTTGNKGLKSLAQPHQWSGWDLTEQRICLEMTLLSWLVSCPARPPASLPSYTGRVKLLGCMDSQLLCTAWKKHHKQTSDISLYCFYNLHVVLHIPNMSLNSTNQW